MGSEGVIVAFVALATVFTEMVQRYVKQQNEITNLKLEIDNLKDLFLTERKKNKKLRQYIAMKRRQAQRVRS